MRPLNFAFAALLSIPSAFAEPPSEPKVDLLPDVETYGARFEVEPLLWGLQEISGNTPLDQLPKTAILFLKKDLFFRRTEKRSRIIFSFHGPYLQRQQLPVSDISFLELTFILDGPFCQIQEIKDSGDQVVQGEWFWPAGIYAGDWIFVGPKSESKDAKIEDTVSRLLFNTSSPNGQKFQLECLSLEKNPTLKTFEKVLLGDLSVMDRSQIDAPTPRSSTQEESVVHYHPNEHVFAVDYGWGGFHRSEGPDLASFLKDRSARESLPPPPVDLFPDSSLPGRLRSLDSIDYGYPRPGLIRFLFFRNQDR